jgi:hypothetical protein
MTSSSSITETYYPKALARFCCKSITALTLKAMAMDASLKLVSSTQICIGVDRDARGKKLFRKLLDETLPRELQVGLGLMKI